MSKLEQKKVPPKPAAKEPAASETPAQKTPAQKSQKPQTEFGGQKGPEPTRYGDWEKNGRCTDF